MTTPSTEQPPPEQEQEYPGRTAEMAPRPRDEMRDYEGRGLLSGRRALITGGDSGIGRAVAVAFAKEGADVAIAYLSEQEDEDAVRTADLVGQAGRRCVTIRGNLVEEDNCQRAVDQTVAELGGLDLLVNNVATQSRFSCETSLAMVRGAGILSPPVGDHSAGSYLAGFLAELHPCFLSDPVERLQDLPRGVVQRDRAAVRAAHRAIGGGERAQQPFHLGGIEAGVDLDGGAAGDGGADAAAQVVERGAAQLALRRSPGSRTGSSRDRRRSTAAGAAFTAMVRLPNGSVSNPEACSSSAMRA